MISSRNSLCTMMQEEVFMPRGLRRDSRCCRWRSNFIIENCIYHLLTKKMKFGHVAVVTTADGADVALLCHCCAYKVPQLERQRIVFQEKMKFCRNFATWLKICLRGDCRWCRWCNVLLQFRYRDKNDT